MLTSFPVCLLAGTALGFLSGLGVGGGSLLMLWLTVVLGMEQAAARSINLLFFIPTAVIATVFRSKEGAVPVKKLLPGILSGCAAAALLCLLARNMDTGLLRKIFGGLFIITGLRELFYRPRKAR